MLGCWFGHLGLVLCCEGGSSFPAKMYQKRIFECSTHFPHTPHPTQRLTDFLPAADQNCNHASTGSKTRPLKAAHDQDEGVSKVRLRRCVRRTTFIILTTNPSIVIVQFHLIKIDQGIKILPRRSHSKRTKAPTNEGRKSRSLRH